MVAHLAEQYSMNEIYVQLMIFTLYSTNDFYLFNIDFNVFNADWSLSELLGVRFPLNVKIKKKEKKKEKRKKT